MPCFVAGSTTGQPHAKCSGSKPNALQFEPLILQTPSLKRCSLVVPNTKHTPKHNSSKYGLDIREFRFRVFVLQDPLSEEYAYLKSY